MKATLIKKLDNGWPIYSLRRADGKMIATTRFPFDEPALMIAKNAGIQLQKLSKQNCDEIFGVVDVEKLFNEVDETIDFHEFCFSSFKLGFNKAMELNKDKVFTLEDVHEAIRKVRSYDEIPNHEGIIVRFNYSKDEIIESIKQPTEIEVEVEMEEYGYCEGCRRAGMWHCAHADTCGNAETRERPKLDADGCLILKKNMI